MTTAVAAAASVAIFINRDERLVKNLRDKKIIVRLAWGDGVEVRAALGNIESAFQAKLFQRKGELKEAAAPA